ncbi:MAG: M56 family metallopeptidase [Bacteroidaceae bacterium]|nr:M56 family metallopeptidase [Bacteroidaceae bacterium]
MKEFLTYILNAAIIVACFHACYYVLLRRETFHRLNRFLLLSVLAGSFVLPFWVITIQRDAPSPEVANSISGNNRVTEAVQTTIQKKVMDIQASHTPVYSPESEKSRESMTETPSETESTKAKRTWEINWWGILLAIWICGTAFSLFQTIKSIANIWILRKKGTIISDADGISVVILDADISPFSWKRTVFISHKDYESGDCMAILEHEKTHCRAGHSYDMLLADILSSFQWFNPAVYLLRNELQNIHEYQADQQVLSKGYDAQAYQFMLLGRIDSMNRRTLSSHFKYQSLSSRISMMNRKASDRNGYLKLVSIPILVALTLLGQSLSKFGNYSFYPEFEDGKTWIYSDGTAKVQTADNVEATMPTSEIATYLRKYKGFKTTRMTLMFDYEVENLKDVQAYAEQLWSAGIKVSIANNYAMLGSMTMPEYRRARIFDEGEGLYRFELNCNSQTTGASRFGPGFYKNPSITGDIEVMKKWISMFDGHGIAIYPDMMPYSDAEQMAKCAWKNGIAQVSLITSENEDNRITLIPEGRSLSRKYPGMTAAMVAERQNGKMSSDYFPTGEHLSNPLIMYRTEPTIQQITDVIKTDKEIIFVFKSFQMSDYWITGMSGLELHADGHVYKQTGYEGLNGFEDRYFWSPDRGYYTQAVHFQAIPDDVDIVDFYSSADRSLFIKGVQVSNDQTVFKNYRYENLTATHFLKTIHAGDPIAPLNTVSINRIDFSDKETTLYAEMSIQEPHSFLGHVGSNFRLTLSNGKTIQPIRIDGVPVDRDFDRHGDHVTTSFQIIFPPISQDEWSEDDSELTGTVCHEDIKITLSPNQEAKLIKLEKIPEGEFSNVQVIDDKQFCLVSLILSAGTMKVSGSNLDALPDGKYRLTLGDSSPESPFVPITISGNGKKHEMTIYMTVRGKKQSILFRQDSPDAELRYITIIL